MKFTPHSVLGFGLVIAVLIPGLMLTFPRSNKTPGPIQSQVIRMKIKTPLFNNRKKAERSDSDLSSTVGTPPPGKGRGAENEITIEKEKEAFVSVQRLVPRELFAYDTSNSQLAVLDKQDQLHLKMAHKDPGKSANRDPASSNGKQRINHLNGAEAEEVDGKFAVILSFSGSINSYNTFYLDSPPRFVADLTGKWRIPQNFDRKVAGEMVRSIRFGKHSEFLRVVVDLTEIPIAAPIITRSSNELMLVLKKRPDQR